MPMSRVEAMEQLRLMLSSAQRRVAEWQNKAATDRNLKRKAVKEATAREAERDAHALSIALSYLDDAGSLEAE